MPGDDSSAVHSPPGGLHNIQLRDVGVLVTRRIDVSATVGKEQHMSIAAILGVEDIDGPLMTAARAAWPRWVERDPELGVVDDLAELRRWQQKADPVDRDRPMVKLAALAFTDVNAAAALVWLLVPKAKGVAAKLADIAADVDGLIAGQLWIEIRSGNPPEAYVATTIMRNVKNAVLAELGIGDAGERADKTWAATVVRDRVVEVPLSEDESPELQRVLRVVVQHLLDVGVIELVEAKILISAAGKADWQGKPMRGRAGLTSPDVLEVLTWLDPTKARTMRREVSKLLDRIALAVRSVDINELLEQHPDYGVPFDDWALGLGSPREARALAGFREYELSAIKFHIVTWDAVAERCGAPDLCPDCIRAEYAT